MPDYNTKQNMIHNKNGKRHKRKKRTAGKIFFNILAITLIIVGIIFCIYKLWVRPPEIEQTHSNPEEIQTSDNPQETTPDISAASSKYVRKKLCYTFLFAASDQSSGNADVIMVLTYDTMNKKVGIVSIPRDTLIDSKHPKINTKYHSGVDTLQNTVSDLLGIPIDFYITVDVEGFVKLVDTIGGVDFDVPCDMSYDDPFQDLSIHFESGIQYLDGNAALKICRWRKNNDGTGYADSDIGRTKTQQALIKEITKKVIANPQKIMSYIDIFSKYIKTDLSLGNMVWFAQNSLGLDIERDLSTVTLPGDGTVTYNGYTYCYQLYPDEVLEIVNKTINPFTEDITLDDMNICEAP
ncbi:MAG: LCP family protein [Eubacteriales bacterium]